MSICSKDAVTKNSELRGVARNVVHPLIKKLAFVIILCVILTIIADATGFWKEWVHAKAGWIFKKYGILIGAQNARDALIANGGNFCNLVMTYSTIQAAAVVFFYSVQDSKKEGISHRVIISYTVGSYGIPFLFILTLFLVPLSYLSFAVGAYWTSFMSLFWGYFVSVAITGLILLATSFQYSIHVIGNVELLQERAMSQLEREAETSGEPGSTEKNYFYTWTYIPHYMKEVMCSEELLCDKLVLVRRLLKVPFMEGPVPIWAELFQNKKKEDHPAMCPNRLKENSISRTYEYYYSNLTAMLSHLEGTSDSDTRDMLYLIFYEFAEQMTVFYRECVTQNPGERDKFKENYLMTVSAMMNAVLSSEVKEALPVCRHILRKVVQLQEEPYGHPEEICMPIYRLYLLFYEGVQKLKKIEYSDSAKDGDWEFIEKYLSPEEDHEIYERYWKIWMKYTTLPADAGDTCFREAMDLQEGYIGTILKSQKVT